ncbi:TonB-dependent receptor [Flavobacterium enshiense]|uniref:TonB-dependent receptor n=1 Tax=Flavobacterium enshiense TaxID=1341165 RepID=UPI00345CD369
MKYYFSLLVFLFAAFTAFSQNTFNAVVEDSITGNPLAGVSVVMKNTTVGVTSNENGEVSISNLPEGKQTFIFSYLGYTTIEKDIELPQRETLILLMSESHSSELDEIIVEGTRSARTLSNIPTRVEVLTEEIDEAATMDPSKVAHLLTHSTGIQVQQTSATSNTANVRIQGLDGRYTQMLKDGFPLYGGFSGSLSIMQIPPLDLRQIEYVKGSTSTLYGGGAISGLINLISKDPKSDETILHVNGSHIGAFDVNMFTSRKYEKIGYTLLAQRNSHRAYDADADGFTDLPELVKYNFNPKIVFYFNDKTNLNIGGTFTTEKRQGGDVQLLDEEDINSTHFYKEKNEISRITTQTKLDHKLAENKTITLRNSFNIFDRNLLIVPTFGEGEYKFAGKQFSSFSEASYLYKKDKNSLITGLNFYSDDFKETPLETNNLRNENYKTLGAFVNYTFDLGEKVAIESGLRTDYVVDEKLYVLPRLSTLFKWTDRLTTRIGGGLGYRNASIFNQEAELLGYKNVLAINRDATKAEQSYGGNADIGYKINFGEGMFINFNQMFFYTYLDNPLLLQNSGSNYEFVNAVGYTQSKGAETFFKFGFRDFVFFLGYTYTDATNHFSGTKSIVTLTPKHSVKGDLLYSLPGKWRIGVDYEFKSSQTLSSLVKTPSYWTYGAVVERYWKQFTFFGNVENIFDYRQTRKESLISAPNNTPQFTEVWAPLDGFVFNFGFKIKL